MVNPVDDGRSPAGAGSGCQPSASAADASSQSGIPNADDITAHDVLAWLATKPADEEYNYCSSTNCAFAQFLRETGIADKPSVAAYDWRRLGVGEDSLYRDIPVEVSEALNQSDMTFGGAFERLSEALAA